MFSVWIILIENLFMLKLLTFKSEWRCFSDLIQMLTPKIITRFQGVGLRCSECRKFRSHIYMCVCVRARDRSLEGNLIVRSLCSKCHVVYGGTGWYVTRCYRQGSGEPKDFVRGGGGFNKFSWGQRERGSGGGSPLVRVSGGSCDLVK